MLLRCLALPVQKVLNTIQRRYARRSLLILDACRDHPFLRQGTRSLDGARGLARMDVPEGADILYSARVGQVALDRLSDVGADPNSVFTRALLPRMAKPGLPLRVMVRQVGSDVRQLARSVGHDPFPSVHDQLDGDFSFLPATIPGVAAQADTAYACAAALPLWQTLESAGDRAAIAALAPSCEGGCPVLAQLVAPRAASLADVTAQADHIAGPIPDQDAAPAAAGQRLHVRPSGAMNARSGPGTDHAIIARLDVRTPMTKIRRAGEWSEAQIAGIGRP